jgi:hypothetical protein
MQVITPLVCGCWPPCLFRAIAHRRGVNLSFLSSDRAQSCDTFFRTSSECLERTVALAQKFARLPRVVRAELYLSAEP